jgi:plasmid stabilization system protein ParE
MSFQIIIEDSAYAEMDEAYQWIAQQSPQNAALWYFEITAKIDSLANFPERCPLAPESKEFAEEIRHLIVGKYRILFIIENNTVFVLYVRHSARDILKAEDR